MRREVVGEADIAIGTHAQRMAVDPHLAALIDAVEFDLHAFARRRSGQGETLAIPAKSRRQIATGAARGFVLAVGPVNAPVVREIDGAPCLIGKFRCFRARDIAAREFPAFIEIRSLARGRTVSKSRLTERERGHKTRRRRRAEKATPREIHRSWFLPPLLRPAVRETQPHRLNGHAVRAAAAMDRQFEPFDIRDMDMVTGAAAMFGDLAPVVPQARKGAGDQNAARECAGLGAEWKLCASSCPLRLSSSTPRHLFQSG